MSTFEDCKLGSDAEARVEGWGMRMTVGINVDARTRSI